jgi:hypothetical protein
MISGDDSGEIVVISTSTVVSYSGVALRLSSRNQASDTLLANIGSVLHDVWALPGPHIAPCVDLKTLSTPYHHACFQYCPLNLLISIPVLCSLVLQAVT